MSSTTTTARGPSRTRNGPGISVFYKDDAGEVFHTYSTYGRGVEVMMGTYNMLDLTPKGRDERTLTTRWSGCATTTAMSRQPVAKAAPATGSS